MKRFFFIFGFFVIVLCSLVRAEDTNNPKSTSSRDLMIQYIERPRTLKTYSHIYVQEKRGSFGGIYATKSLNSGVPIQ